MKARARHEFEGTVIPESGVQQRSSHRSGLHAKRLTPRTVALAALLDDIDAVLATTAKPRATFDALAGIVRRALPLRALTIVRCDEPDDALVWCADARDELVAEAESAALSSLAQFGDVAHRDAWTPLGGGTVGKLHWLAVPLRTDEGRVVAVLGVATGLETNDEGSVAFVMQVARRVAARFAREEHVPSSLPSDEVVAEIDRILLDGLEYRGALEQVARILGTRVGTACVFEVLGTSSSQVVHTCSLPETAMLDVVQPLLDRVVARGASLTMEHALVSLAAEELGVGWLCVVPLRAGDEILGALALLGPAEQPLALSAEQLDDVAHRAAAAIRNGQLYEEAVSGLRARDEILSTVSHDLKNPLSIILLSAARLLEDGPDARIIGGRPAAEVIHRSAHRMRRLVSDLLDAAALDSGTLTMRPSRQDATKLIVETLDLLAPVAAEAGVTLHDDVPRTLPPVFVDPDRISQVLSNIVGNAIKFTPAGGTVRIGAGAIGDALEISVSDTGIGISPSQLPRVFDRFWRADGTRKLGTGLGLAIAKSIIELSGGGIEAKSEPGVGTVMSFTVPIAQRLQLV